MEPVSDKEPLKREIGVRSLTLLILNITVGTGIFVIPAIIAEGLGPAAIVAYVVCGLLIFLIALCFAEVGSRFTTSGGTYTYIEAAFGPFVGFIANNIFWFGACVLSDAAVANALADTVKLFIPALANGIPRAAFFLLVFGGLALINVRGVKNGVRFIEWVAVGKLVPLVLLVIVAIPSIATENLRWTSSFTVDDIGTASLLLIYAFLGVETAITNGGEIKNPRRTVPLGIFLGIGSVLVLYVCIQLAVQGVLGQTILVHNDAPLAATAGIILGTAGATIMLATAIISMLGNLGGEVLAIPRILYAGARDGLMPRIFYRAHPRFLTPHIAVVFYASLGFLFAISGGFKQLAVIASAATLLIYLGVVLATIKLRRSASGVSEQSFRIPGGMVVPVLAVGAIVWLLSTLSWQQLSGMGIFILVCSLVYVLTKPLRTNTLANQSSTIS
jgi:basic amino acid/polyamine antiporter, APA family